MSAPSEEEIRAALAREWKRSHQPWPPSPELEWDLGWNRFAGMGDEVFDLEEFRPSEVERLDSLRHDATAPLRAEIERRLTDAVVSAILAFAAEYPDAPRAQREAPAA